MKHQRAIKLSMLLVPLCLAGMSCKPGRNSGNSQVKAVTGIDATTGEESALALLPVRNYTTAALGISSDNNGVQQASAMVRTRLLALVECRDVVTPTGGKISGAKIMTLLEARAALDDLYVDAERHLITSSDTGQLLEFENNSAGKLAIPCHLYGKRLLSFAVLNDMQVRAAGLPKALPTNKDQAAIASRIYLLAQAVHLAVRSSHSGQSDAVMTPMAQAIKDMASDQGIKTLSLAKIIERVRAADTLYNPCTGAAKEVAAGALPYTLEWKTNNYACQAEGGSSDVVHFRAGGPSGKRYSEVRDLIAAEIQRTHEKVVYPQMNKNDVRIQDLWDILTGTTPWTNAKPLASYLASGQGIDFIKTFMASEPSKLNLTANDVTSKASYLTHTKSKPHARNALLAHNPRIRWSASSASGRPATLKQRADAAGLTNATSADSSVLDAISSLGKK